MKLFARWVADVGRWLAEMWHVWLALLVSGLALWIALCLGVGEPGIRWTGLWLQLLGIGTVMWGIRETRKLFNHPSLLELATNWLRRFPRLRPRPNHLAMSIVIPGGSGVLSGHAIHTSKPTSNFEERIEALEKGLDEVNGRLCQIRDDMEANVRETNVAISRADATRASEDTAIRDRLEATATGGVHISAIGALWLFIGVTLSTASVEIDKLLR